MSTIHKPDKEKEIHWTLFHVKYVGIVLPADNEDRNRRSQGEDKTYSQSPQHQVKTLCVIKM